MSEEKERRPLIKTPLKSVKYSVEKNFLCNNPLAVNCKILIFYSSDFLLNIEEKVTSCIFSK
jgi:hypothetical protein